MKAGRLYLVAIVLLMSVGTSMAQRSFKLGLKGGANLSTLRGGDVYNASDPTIRIGDNETRLTGFVGGAYARFGNSLFIQPELLFSQKGGTFNVYRDGITNDQNRVDVRFTNIDVPVLLGIRIGQVLRLNAGPIASLQVAQNQGLREALNEVGARSARDNLNRAALGYQAGVGFDIGNLSLDLRYEGNLSNVINTTDSNLNSQLMRKGNLWQATLGFAIF
ncbi:porin family protein [Telluribacter sp. SYSU D00476]|uniref:porin family protein n=1 Tax=Telluribacter sp. SYSU D00476 TaxID=2811430 RepID=UPI001FF4DAB4|nr:porin family protein [Telluribacter sp. SYSU D00476]